MGIDNKPVCSRNDLVVQELDGEILIYDLKENKAFCLNETSARVWRSCDGSKTMAEIGRELGHEDMAWLALNDLKKEKLIEFQSKTPSRFAGMSRREVVRKIGVGAMVALPIVASLAAPPVAHAQSCGGSCGMTLACPSVSTCSCSNNSTDNMGICGL